MCLLSSYYSLHLRLWNSQRAKITFAEWNLRLMVYKPCITECVRHLLALDFCPTFILCLKRSRNKHIIWKSIFKSVASIIHIIKRQISIVKSNWTIIGLIDIIDIPIFMGHKVYCFYLAFVSKLWTNIRLYELLESQKCKMQKRYVYKIIFCTF